MNFNMIYTLNRFIIRLIIVHRSVQSSIGSTRLVIKLLSLMTLHSVLVKRELLIVSMVSTTMNPNHIPIKKVYLQGSKAHISIVEFKLYPEYSIKQPISPGASQTNVRKSGKRAYLSYENQ